MNPEMTAFLKSKDVMRNIFSSKKNFKNLNFLLLSCHDLDKHHSIRNAVGQGLG